MSKKDFKRGVEAAVNAQRGFNEKQAKATQELGKRLIHKIDEQGKIIEIVLDDLNEQEKEKLYGLKSVYDIADLDDTEKEVLLSVLFTLLVNHNQNTDQQRTYYLAVKKYLGITDADSDFDMESVENIDSRTQSKAIYGVVCEFLFLNQCNHNYLNNFSDILDYFPVLPKDKKEIAERIDFMYETLGIDGIVKHYDLSFEDDLEDILNPAEEQESDDSDEEDEHTPEDDELPRVEKNASVARSLQKEKLDALTIDTVLNVTKPTTYRRKAITIKGMINCQSDLIFEKCVIYYQVGENTAITVSTGGKLIFKDCCIIGSNINSKDGGKIFIKSVDVYDMNNMTIEITGCYFAHCGYFLKSYNEEVQVSIERNLIEDPSENFLDIKSKYCIFSHNEVLWKQEDDHCYPKIAIGGKIWSENDETRAKIKNNIFVGSAVAPTCRVHISDAIMERCLFDSLSSCVTTDDRCNISDCIFYRCSDVVSIRDSFHSSQIYSCQFLLCTGSVIIQDIASPTRISGCEFRYLKGEYKSQGLLLGAVIGDAIGKNTSLLLFHGDKNESASVIYQCVFDTILLDGGYLARCVANDKLKESSLIIEDCIFRNIYSNKNQLIKRFETYEGTFSNKSIRTVSVLNCSGKDNISALGNASLPENAELDFSVRGANTTMEEIERLRKMANANS